MNVSNISDENVSNDTTTESVLQIYSLQTLVEVAQGSDLQLNLGPHGFFFRVKQWWMLVMGLIVGGFTNNLYIHLEPNWPLFWLEKDLFWGVDLQK